MDWLGVALTMTCCLSASGMGDSALSFNRNGTMLNLTSSELTTFHNCLCQKSHFSCTFSSIHKNVSMSNISSSENYTDTYWCSHPATGINCTRMTVDKDRSCGQSGCFSFNLKNESCDIDCVDIILGGGFSATSYTNATNTELCPRDITPPPPETALPIVVIVIVISILIFILIIVITVIVCRRIKRKVQLKHDANYTVNGEDSYKYSAVEKTKDSFVMSSAESTYPGLEVGQEPLYYEVEGDKQNPAQKDCEENGPENENVYTKLHTRIENITETYDTLGH